MMRKLSFLLAAILVISAIICEPVGSALTSYAGSMSGSFTAGASSYYKQNRTPVDPSCAIDGDEYSSWDSYGEYEWAWFELTSRTGRVSVSGLRIMNGKCKSKAYGDEYYYKNARIKRFSLLVDGVYQFSRVIKDTREWQYVDFGKTLSGTSFRILVESVYEGTGTPKGNYGVCITELELIPAMATPAPTVKVTPKPTVKATPTPTRMVTPTPTAKATSVPTPAGTANPEGLYYTDGDEELMPSDAAEFGKMLGTIEDITANTGLFLKAMGITDIYSENAMIAAEAYLSVHPDVRQVRRAGSGLVFETSDGLLGGFATDKYDPDCCGFSQVNAKDAFETYLEGSGTDDIIIPTSATLTNKNVRLLAFDTSDPQMNAIYEFDRRILNDYSQRIGGTFTSYTGQDALKAIRDKSYADSGFLVIAGHGIKMNFWNYNGEFIVPSTFIDAGTYNGSEEIFEFIDFENSPTSKKKDLFFESKGNGRFMVAFRYKWLENISGEAVFDNTLVVPAVCYFGRDNNLINYFLDRGAAAVIACAYKESLYQHYMSLYALTADAGLFDNANDVGSLFSSYSTHTPTLNERTEIVDATSVSMSIRERLDLRDIDSFRLLASGIMQSRYSAGDPDPNATGNNGTPLSFEGRLYYWSMYTEADKADDRGPLKVNTRRTDTYLEGAGAVRGQAVSGAKALEGAQITIYRWMDHRFEEYTEYSVTDINGEYSLSDVPYGLYGLKAEFEGMAGYTAFEHCSQETEVGPVDMEQPIRSIVVSDSPAYFTSGGSDFYYNVHAIGAGEQHLLSADGNLSLFSLLGADIDHVRFRVWLHDDRSVFVEHIDPDQVNAYSSFDTPVTYALYRLDGKNRFVRIKSAVATGGDGKIKSIKLYENGEQVNEITFDYTAVLRLNAFFRKEGITFGGVRNAQGWNTTISYYLSNDTKGKLVFDSAAGDTSYMRDDVINRYYRPMNVRPDDQTRENRVDVLVDDISKAIGKMELKSTEKNSGGGYTERYEIGEYYTVTVSVNRDGMIESVVFNDTNYIFLVLTMMSNRRMEPTDAMIKFYEAAVASEAVSLTEAQRSELLEYDFNASAKITVEEGLFSNASNTKKSSDKTIGNTRVIYYKYRDYYAGDWVTSSLTLRFDQ